jgi:hypothetical protein
MRRQTSGRFATATWRDGGRSWTGTGAVPGDDPATLAHGHDGTHHLAHADGTCAAAGVTVPYTPSPPDADPLGVPSDVALPVTDMASTEGGRSPPDPAELQLLRIWTGPHGARRVRWSALIPPLTFAITVCPFRAARQGVATA